MHGAYQVPIPVSGHRANLIRSTRASSFHFRASLPCRTMPDPDSRRGKFLTLFESLSLQSMISIHPIPSLPIPYFTSSGFSHHRLTYPITCLQQPVLYYTTIAVPYRVVCILIWPPAYRLEATHDLSPVLLSEFFFLPSLCLLSRRGAVLQLIILLFRISVTREGSAHIWLDFSNRCYASTAYAAIAITVCSTHFFFSPSPPSPRNASPKSVCCKVRLSFSFSSIKLILSSVTLTSSLAVEGWGKVEPSRPPTPHFFFLSLCLHSDIVMASSHIL